MCPRRTAPIRTGVAPAETFRGPRGLRKGVVQDLGRLYRLRRKVMISRTSPATPRSPAPGAAWRRVREYYVRRLIVVIIIADSARPPAPRA